MRARFEISTLRRVGAFLAALFCLAALAVPAITQAATPSAGVISKRQSVEWSGGPFAASTLGVAPGGRCVGPNASVCDQFSLTVDAPSGAAVAVAITSDIAGDDYDLFVFYADGSSAASGQRSAPDDDQVVFEHRLDRGSGPYEVRIDPAIVTPGSTYHGMAALGRRADVDDTSLSDCSEDVPDSLSLDTGQPITLDVELLLNGVSRADAEALMAKAARAYQPLNILLRVKRYRTVDFPDTSSLSQVIQQARDLYGGVRPRGADVVHVLTVADPPLGGEADCIGGVRYPNRGFSASMFDPLPFQKLGPFRWSVDWSAVLAAHEIGHNMGGKHVYANCVEGLTTDALIGRELSPCTVMFGPAWGAGVVDFSAFKFSTLNGAIIRAHAINYTAP